MYPMLQMNAGERAATPSRHGVVDQSIGCTRPSRAGKGPKDDGFKMVAARVLLIRHCMSDPFPIDEQLTIEEAKAIMHGGLGKAELELVTSFCAPLYWAIRDPDG
jgi:hypothetical protein